MSDFSPKQNLALFKLVITGEATLQSEFRPNLSPKERKQLLEAGLVELRPRPKGRGKLLAATDKAWGWAEENLSAPISRSQEGSVLLHQLFRVIDGFLQRRDFRFSDFFQAEIADSVPIEERIQSTCLALAGGRSEVDIRLKDLRKELPEIPRDELDQGLLSLADLGKLEFHHIDDPQSMNEEDHAAALSILGFEKQLVRWMV